MAEFGKIICISIGIYDKNNKILIRSFAGDDEEELLKEFGEIFNRPKLKKRDFVYTTEKNLIFLGLLKISHQWNATASSFRCLEKNLGKFHIWIRWNCGNLVIGKKFYFFGINGAYFGVPTPKDDIDGSMVSSIYYIEKDLPRIVKYCEKMS